MTTLPAWLQFGRQAQRVESLVRYLRWADELAVPRHRVFNRSWRAAVTNTRFPLLPASVRQNLRVICDIGANRGEWAAGILELARPERLIAFEPIPEVFATLSSRLAGHAGVSCRQVAVGARRGSAAFYITRARELSGLLPLGEHGHSLHGEGGEPLRTIEVPVVRLDDELVEFEEISLIKLDVQGGEAQVIGGATQVLSRCRCLVTEVLYARDYYQGALGFLELARLIEETTPLRLNCLSEPALDSNGRGAWADAIFLRVDTSR